MPSLRRTRAVIAIVSFVLSVTGVAAEGASPLVWVFTTPQLPSLQHVTKADAVFVLGDIEKPLTGLSFPYPGTYEKARVQASAVLNSQRGQAAMARVRLEARAVAMAWRSGIAKLPAVLVDQQYVVYGEIDVQRALERVRRYRHAQ